MDKQEFIRLARQQGHQWARVYRMDSGQVKAMLPGFETDWGEESFIYASALKAPVVVHKQVESIKERELKWDF